VMVLPVTAKMLACCVDAVAMARDAKGGSEELTGLDEDLHDCGCSEGVYELSVLGELDDEGLSRWYQVEVVMWK
jgi:hypothetical protein